MMNKLIVGNREYKLKTDITNDQLKQMGFRHGIYTAALYRKSVVLDIIVDLNESPPYLGTIVRDDIFDHPYAPYYDKPEKQDNIVVEEIRRSYKEELDKLVKRGILTSRKINSKSRRNKNVSTKNSTI